MAEEELFQKVKSDPKLREKIFNTSNEIKTNKAAMTWWWILETMVCANPYVGSEADYSQSYRTKEPHFEATLPIPGYRLNERNREEPEANDDDGDVEMKEAKDKYSLKHWQFMKLDKYFPNLKEEILLKPKEERAYWILRKISPALILWVEASSRCEDHALTGKSALYFILELRKICEVYLKSVYFSHNNWTEKKS